MRYQEFAESSMCPECGGVSFSDLMLAEKQDACYHKVKSRYKVWPSAYASGALVQCRKKGAANWGNKSKNESMMNEFAPSNDNGDNEPDEYEILHRLAAMWWLGTEQQMIKAQRTLASMGWEIGEDEGYDDGGVFVVRANDEHGKSYISWPHEDLQLNEQGMAEGYSLGKVLTLPELLDQIKHILAAKHPGIGWRMTMPAENTFLFSAKNDYNVWSMLVVEPGGDDWVAVGHGMVDPDGKPIIFDRQQLPMTLASASEIADEAIQTYHDIDLSDYADPNELAEQGMSENAIAEMKNLAGLK